MCESGDLVKLHPTCFLASRPVGWPLSCICHPSFFTLRHHPRPSTPVACPAIDGRPASLWSFFELLPAPRESICLGTDPSIWGLACPPQSLLSATSRPCMYVNSLSARWKYPTVGMNSVFSIGTSTDDPVFRSVTVSDPRSSLYLRHRVQPCVWKPLLHLCDYSRTSLLLAIPSRVLNLTRA